MTMPYWELDSPQGPGRKTRWEVIRERLSPLYWYVRYQSWLYCHFATDDGIEHVDQGPVDPDPAFPWLHIEQQVEVPPEWLAEHLAHLAPDKEKPATFTFLGWREYQKSLSQYDVARDWPASHVAFSGIPGIGRPLEWVVDDRTKMKIAILSGHWEATPEEQEERLAIREHYQAIRDAKKVCSDEVRTIQSGIKIDSWQGQPDFALARAGLKKLGAAIKEYEKLSKLDLPLPPS